MHTVCTYILNFARFVQVEHHCKQVVGGQQLVACKQKHVALR
jgi:hypothetical protein